MHTRQHEVPTAQGTPNAPRRPYCARRIGLQDNRFVPGAEPDRYAEEAGKIAGHHCLESSINCNLASFVSGAVKRCGHSDIVSFVERMACWKTSGIEEYFVALLVSRIHKDQ